MNYILLSLFVLIAVVSWMVNFRDKKQLAKGIQLLLTLSIITLFFHAIDELSNNSYWYLMTFVIVNWGLSLIKIMKKPLFSHLALLLTSLSVLLFNNAHFVSGEYDVNLASPVVIGMLFLSASLLFIISKKTRWIGKFFKTGYKNERGFSRGLFFFIAGLFLLINHFITAEIGALLLLVGITSSIFYLERNDTEWNMALGILPFVLIPVWLKMGNIDILQLDLGRGFVGLFFGFAFGYLAFIQGK
ncbi:MAG: hypothetical protein KJ941_12510, partial [Bacteroidetes bacterium]|nr:hypothetical protein [Bacteroidota bacterium]